jgi:hypothetical protein
MDEIGTPPAATSKSSKKLTFAVVCGMPRSGTRQFADFLNRHPDICIQGEIRDALVPSIRDLMVAGDTTYSTGSSGKNYQVKRAQIVVDNFSGFSKAKREVKRKSKIVGFKTPRVERRHEDLDIIVGDSFRKTEYFYCIRNVADCYLSLLSMPWFSATPSSYISNYISSLNDAVKLGRIGQRSRARVGLRVLNLDDFIRSDAKAHWISDRMFSVLPITTEQSWFDEIVANTENRNATENAVGKKRAKTLPSEALTVFQRRYSSIEKAVNRFNLAFNENLSCDLPIAEISA